MIYVASKTSHAAMWRNLRAQGVPINATWIDEAGADESKDLTDLAARCVREASEARALILYCEAGEILKGALIEVGSALGTGRPVFSVGDCDGLRTALRSHPLWRECRSLDEALDAALTEEFTGKLDRRTAVPTTSERSPVPTILGE